MPIKVLPPEVADKIAAGEVVERPASVVKELVENALDAGATEIRVEVFSGGTRLIKVTDNGCGIPSEEVELAFARYATSKISTINDLSAIRTLGFRGEALASIAAVSKVTMITRSAGEPIGVLIRVEGGKMVRKEPRGAPVGTTVSVENLFYNVPARRKFLKHPATEMAHITETVVHYAMAYPEVKFALYREGQLSFHSPGSGDMKDVLARVYGPEIAGILLKLEATEGPLKFYGYVSPPSLHKPQRSHSFFVNRRWVQDAVLSKALLEAYHGFLPTGRYPLAVISLEIDPSLVDVNVHPTKREVRFHNSEEVYQALQKALRQLLLSMQSPFVASPKALSPAKGEPEQKLFPIPQAKPSPPPEPTLPLAKTLPTLRVLGQISLTYIVAEGPDGLYLIDQHSAHERVIYEKLKRDREKAIPSQRLLEPLTVELPPYQSDLVEFLLPSLKDVGFDMEEFGPNTWLVRAVPAPFASRDVRKSLTDFIDALISGGTDHLEGDRVLATLACHCAVRAGETLSMEEMRKLVQEMEAIDVMQTCPHGRPTVVRISIERLAKEFGRGG
jgi:DNA mismatch repair protein MutL